jgi:hypothetical protein
MALQVRHKPVLLIDIDGVLSVFGFAPDDRPAGTWANVEGVLHLLSASAVRHLHEVLHRFDPVWASGWEEKANEHLPGLLGLGPFPTLDLDRSNRQGTSTPGHWKLTAIDAQVGPDRPVAWIDDDLNAACDVWAAARPAPTLLVRTDPATGLGAADARALTAWADGLA